MADDTKESQGASSDSANGDSVKSADSASFTKKTTNKSTKKAAARKRVSKKKSSQAKPPAKKTGKKPRVDRPYPRVSLEEATKVPIALREKNGGNPWEPEQVRIATDNSKGNQFYYLTAASRDFGFTEGTRDTDEISLTEFGKKLVYAESPLQELEAKKKAFLSIPVFRQVCEHFKGGKLPEMQYLKNTLESKFSLHPDVHEEFVDLYQRNANYVGVDPINSAEEKGGLSNGIKLISASGDFMTVAEPEGGSDLLCFVAMPFSEKTEKYPKGFFKEVLARIIGPAGREAGFRVVTAQKQGSDVIHATIINGLLDADLVVVDLTEHNPNVLFELGVRMAEDKPVALIKSEDTGPIFDVDHLLRVEMYNPNLWPSTVENDLPKIKEHIEGAWENRKNSKTYMKILRSKGGDPHL